MMLTEKYDPIGAYKIDCCEIKNLLSYLEAPNRKTVSKSIKERVCWHLHDLLGIYISQIKRLERCKEEFYKEEIKNEEI